VWRDGFLNERRNSIASLEAFTKTNWDQLVNAEHLVGLSAADMVWAWVTHDVLHIRQLSELRYAMIASQASDAINKINAEEFRTNQAETMRAGEANRAQMNEAQRVNLGILDQQYQRQSQAKSNTKAQALEVAKSLAQKKAENRKVNNRQAVLENMYPAFAYSKSGVAYKDPRYTAMFNIPDTGEGATSKEDITSPTNFFQTDESTKSKKKERNGGIVKAIKNL
jgi:hypothetical protein